MYLLTCPECVFNTFLTHPEVTPAAGVAALRHNVHFVLAAQHLETGAKRNRGKIKRYSIVTLTSEAVIFITAGYK